MVVGKEDNDLHIPIGHRNIESYHYRAVVEKENVSLGFMS